MGSIGSKERHTSIRVVRVEETRLELQGHTASIPAPPCPTPTAPPQATRGQPNLNSIGPVSGGGHDMPSSRGGRGSSQILQSPRKMAGEKGREEAMRYVKVHF